MANHYYIISEVLFFDDKDNKITQDFVSASGIDLSTRCDSIMPSLTEIKKVLIHIGCETKELFNQNGRFEISASQKDNESLWLIFTDIENEDQKISMFEIGRGSNPDLLIAFVKTLSQTHGRFLYYCDSGSMTLITKDKNIEQIKNEIYS